MNATTLQYLLIARLATNIAVIIGFICLIIWVATPFKEISIDEKIINKRCLRSSPYKTKNMKRNYEYKMRNTVYDRITPQAIDTIGLWVLAASALVLIFWTSIRA